MTPNQKRKSVIDKYDEIIGRNIYSQELRDWCYKPYKDGKYYSDCSSSICYAYKEAGLGFGTLNTAGMYNSKNLTTVNVEIKDGIPNESDLRMGDMLLFAGNDSSRPLRIGHVEMYVGSGKICGHGSGRPSYKDLKTYCKNRYNSFAPGGWRKGVVCVKRYIQDEIEPEGWVKDSHGWWWSNGDGTFAKNEWKLINHHWYLFGENGYIRTGWHKWNPVTKQVDPSDGSGDWYFLDNTDGGDFEGACWHSKDNGAQEIWYVE